MSQELRSFESVFADPKTQKILDNIARIVKSMKPPGVYVNLKGELVTRDPLKDREKYVVRSKNGKD